MMLRTNGRHFAPWKALLFVALFCFSGCKKPNSSELYTIKPELRAIFNYRLGSYWIMKDSLTGQIDSFSVTLVYNHRPPYNYDNHNYVGIKITDFPITATADTITWGISLSPQYNNHLVFENSKQGFSFSSLQILAYPFIPGTDPYIQDGIAYSEPYFSRLTMYKSASSMNDTANLALVFNKNGFIRMQDNIKGYSHIWHLTRFLIK